MNQEVRQRGERDLEDDVLQEETRKFGEERQKVDQKKLKDLYQEVNQETPYFLKRVRCAAPVVAV